nr:probable thiopurine S-methyltransferase [Lytechinus pictus]
MSSSSGQSSSISRLEEDVQPSPKRRKNSSAKSRENQENGFNSNSNSEPTPSLPTKRLNAPTTQVTDNHDNGNIVSSTTTATTTTAPKERDTATETTPNTVSGTEVVNGAVVTRAENSNDGAESKPANGQAGAETTDQSVRRNQFGEVSDGHMSLEDWLEQWRKGKTRFTMKVPNRMLVKHHGKLVEGKTNPVFFLPCCGKSLDIKWLSDKGYSVVGVEIAEMACRQFFDGHDIKYEEEDIKDGPQGKLFKGIDCDIRLYSCDFFSVTSALIGQFDCIWDRGSYAAMNPSDRQRYCDVISKLLKDDGRYLLDCFELEHSVFAGPPHTTDPKDLERYFDSFDVNQIEHVDAMNDWTRSWGVEYFYQNDFILTHKKK